MSLDDSLNRIPWVIVFVIGVQFHFIAIIFPEIREYNIHVLGISLAVISATLILILYIIKKRQQEKISNKESLR